MGPDRCPLAHEDQPCQSAETAWRSGPAQTAPKSSVAAAGLLAVAVVEGPPYPGGAGSGGQGVETLSASGGKCDVGMAEAACEGTGWSVAAGTGVWVKAVEIAPG